MGTGISLKLAIAAVVASSALMGACTCHMPSHTPDLVEVIQRASPAVVAIQDERGILGSGFRLANTRLIVTAAHLLPSLQGSPTVVWDSRRWPARLISLDQDKDLALIELDDDAPMPGLRLASGSPPPPAGEWILVLGCPFGARTTATVGIVSAAPGAVLEPAALRRRMQLNAAVNPGNSGGPVVNFNGLVVGIANATIPGGHGLGFAIPVAELQALLAEPTRGP